MIFAIDRAEPIGADGEIRQGVFNLSYPGCTPSMTILAPRNYWGLEEELRFTFSYGGPVTIHYPRGQTHHGFEEHREPICFGKAELLFHEEKTVLSVLGSMVNTVEHIREGLKVLGQPRTLVNMRSAKPVDREFFAKLAEMHQSSVTSKEGMLRGGFGPEVTERVSS